MPTTVENSLGHGTSKLQSFSQETSRPCVAEVDKNGEERQESREKKLLENRVGFEHTEPFFDEEVLKSTEIEDSASPPPLYIILSSLGKPGRSHISSGSQLNKSQISGKPLWRYETSGTLLLQVTRGS